MMRLIRENSSEITRAGIAKPLIVFELLNFLRCEGYYST